MYVSCLLALHLCDKAMYYYKDQFYVRGQQVYGSSKE